MNKARAKNILHWVGFVAVVAAAVYIAVIAKGLGVGERITLAASTLVGLFVALAKVFPVLDKTVDETLPDDAAPAQPVPPADVAKLPMPSPKTPVICLLALGSLLLAGQAGAAGPEFGGCIRDGSVCFGPSATVTVGQFNFSTSKFSGGIVPGVGYGATYAPNEWYATGLAGYLAFTVGKGAPNEAIPSLMLSFANYLRLGAGVSITEGQCPAQTPEQKAAGQDQECPVQTQWRLLFGIGSDFGGSPKYVASQGAR